MKSDSQLNIPKQVWESVFTQIKPSEIINHYNQRKKFIKDICKDLTFYKTKEIFKGQEYPSSELFIDKLFPNISTSLYNENINNLDLKNQKTIRNLVWCRPKEIFGKNEFRLYYGIEITDVHQGLLENQYFLSVLSAIAEKPDRFNKILLTKEIPMISCYLVKLYINGKPKTIYIDDFFPCHQSKAWAFSYSGPYELWVQVLEKAWAKLCGNYVSTIKGNPSDALNALTEAPCFTYNHQKILKDALWSKIIDASNHDFIICTNCINKVDEELESKGLVNGQTYTIIAAKDYYGQRFLRLRNPWGGFEWKGDFSDGSDKWTPDLKDYLGYVNDCDGVFFMLFDDFFKYFPFTYISNYFSGNKYNFAKLRQTDNSYVVAKFNISNPCKVIVGLHQKQERFYRKKHNNYKTEFSRLHLAKYNQSSSNSLNYTLIGSEFSDHEKLYISTDLLQEGEYHIFAKINWSMPTEYCSLVLSTYSTENIVLSEVRRTDIPDDYLSQLLTSYNIQNSTKELIYSTDVYLYQALRNNETGYAIASIFNGSETDSIRLNLAYNNNPDKYKLISGHFGLQENETQNVEIIALPKSYKTLIFELFDHSQNDLNLSNLNLNKFQLNFNSNTMLHLGNLLENLEKQSLNKDCYYQEYHNEEGTFLIIQNNSSSKTYNFILNFTSMVNLVFEQTLNDMITVGPLSFEYLKLIRKNENGNCDFSFTYTYSQVSV